MSWIALTLASAVLLGIYDIAKKQAVRGNAVPMVLLCNVATAAAIWAAASTFVLLARAHHADQRTQRSAA